MLGSSVSEEGGKQVANLLLVDKYGTLPKVCASRSERRIPCRAMIPQSNVHKYGRMVNLLRKMRGIIDFDVSQALSTWFTLS